MLNLTEFMTTAWSHVAQHTKFSENVAGIPDFTTQKHDQRLAQRFTRDEPDWCYTQL